MFLSYFPSEYRNVLIIRNMFLSYFPSEYKNVLTIRNKFLSYLPSEYCWVISLVWFNLRNDFWGGNLNQKQNLQSLAEFPDVFNCTGTQQGADFKNNQTTKQLKNFIWTNMEQVSTFLLV